MADIREQIAWQVRALHVVDDLLRAQLKSKTFLPVLRWHVQDAGCTAYGESFAGTDDLRRQAVNAWADRLGAEVRETPLGHGQARVTVSATVELVRVTVTALLHGDDQKEVEK
ncbi:hypothetical protein ACBJ59_36455 [Nonomuraea sp. MTCD27]|uniref:hypothetical protein n=1 Tax=Nonomuraea sp. MTCD27 TaxID=1676747 RepID=UPI0035C0F32A